MFPELIVLEFLGSNENCLANHFPKLQNINLHSHRVTKDAFMEFKDKNPQLQSLFMKFHGVLTPSIWEGDRRPNVVEHVDT